MLSVVSKKINSFFKEGHERSIKTKENILISFFVKGAGIIVSLLLIPMTINYVSPVQYGVWLTISSIVSWMTFFDVGMALGLRNNLTKALASNHLHEANTFVSTTYVVLAIISCIIFLIFYPLSFYVNWNEFLNVPVNIQDNLHTIITLVVGFFCIQFVVQVINQILIASQSASISSVLVLLGQTAVLISIYLVKQFIPGNLLILTIILAGTPILIYICSSLYLYSKSFRFLTPSLKGVNLSAAKTIVNLGGKFFLVQVSSMIIFQTDNIVITKILGPETVTTFNISYKLFSILTSVTIIIVTPLWAAFTDAYARNDMNWIRATLRKIRFIWLLLSLAALAILIFSKPIYKVWLGDKIHIPGLLSVAMFFYIIVFMWQLLHVYVLNGIGKLRLQLILNLFGAFTNIPLSFLLGRKFGLMGIMISNISVVFIIGLFLSIQCKKIAEGTTKKIWLT